MTVVQRAARRPESGLGGTSPDAKVQIGKLVVALEVELSAKTPQRLLALLYGLARTCDDIWYFGPQATSGPMQRALA